jgi:hypothetical protein
MKFLKISLVVIATLLLTGGLFLAGAAFWMFHSRPTFAPWGMMGVSGDRGAQRFDKGEVGPGMMRRGGWGQSGFGNGMMGQYDQQQAVNVTPLTVDEAITAGRVYLESQNIKGLEIFEVMIFDNNAYLVVGETDSGIGAFELLVDPVSKVAYPEHGPNMMWNLKYGGINHANMMGGRMGMMGGNYSNSAPLDVTAEMPVTAEQAVTIAQKYLDQEIPGTSAANDPVKFYGYYTLDFMENGKPVGMLSVNGFSGDVFLHTWHGQFIEEKQLK